MENSELILHDVWWIMLEVYRASLKKKKEKKNGEEKEKNPKTKCIPFVPGIR